MELGKIKMGGKKPKELQVPIKRNNSKCYLFITKIGTVPVPPQNLNKTSIPLRYISVLYANCFGLASPQFY